MKLRRAVAGIKYRVRRRTMLVVRRVLDRLPPAWNAQLIPTLRYAYEFQISAQAVKVVRARVKRGSSLLVFGVGRDSRTWETVNRRDCTTFIEHDPEWAEMSASESPKRRIFCVDYSTTVETSMEMVSKSEIPELVLPSAVTDRKWDVIVVDGPTGYMPEHPGRASSIKAAERLVAPGGLILIDDYNRPLEQHACSLVFGSLPSSIIDPRRPVAKYEY